MISKTWKTDSVQHVLLEILRRKGAMADVELFNAFTEEYKDLGFADFNECLMRLEISRKIRTTSLTRGKRRVEIVVEE